MSVENPENANGGDIEVKPQNGDSTEHRLNGMSNGHIDSNSSSKHKSSSKDKHRDKEKDYKSSSKSSSSNRNKDSDRHKSSSSSNKDKHRDKDRERDKDKDKDKHKSSSSSHKSSRDKDREREERKDRDKEKDKEKDKDRDREREKNRDKEPDRNRDKTRDRDKEKEKDKERSKEKSERDEKRSDADKDKDRKKDHKSSSSSHNKDRDKDKDRQRDKDKDHHRSSSSKDKHSSSSSKSKDKDKGKHSSSSSSKDKDRHHRDKDKDRDRKDRDKDKKHSSSSSSSRKLKESDADDKKAGDIKLEVKDEFVFPSNKYYPDPSPTKQHKKNDSYVETKREFKDEYLNHSQASSCDYSLSQFREDEPQFDIKAEQSDEEVNIENDTVNENETIDESNNTLNVTATTGPNVSYDDEDDDMPLAMKRKKREPIEEEDSDEDTPLIAKKKSKTAKEKKDKKAKKKKHEESEDEDEKPKKKKAKKEKPVQVKSVSTTETSPTKGRKKKEDAPDVWRWWEEEKKDDGAKWNFLEHKGPVFAPDYEPLPNNVKFFYDGKEIKLSQDAEEVACFYAKMLNHDYVTKQVFNDNFFKDWRKTMTSKEKDTIKHLTKCNFDQMFQYFTAQSEKNKNRTKEEKLVLKEANEKLLAEFGFCTIDGHKEKIGNFKLEPPGLFRGRGEHPKMGLVKRRLMPEDILINCSKTSKIPAPPKGRRWKEVRHDNSVTWLASWTENVQGQVKYIMLNPSSKLKGEKDYQKYETARRLDKHIEKIRATYRDEWKSKEMRIRQRGVALYFIDKLALRAGNEKDEDQADTVGCCSLRVEHVALHKSLNGKENVVVFDFPGKDSIRYYNEVEVEKRVFKNLELFMDNKKEGDDLFDRLNTSVLNEHLRDLMDGLTAKVFRTYNASITLQNQLDLLTDPDATVPEKLFAYNRANRAVAVLCNHQRSVPKGHAKSMENLKEKIRQKREAIDDTESELYDLQKAKRGSVKEKINCDKKKKQLERHKEQLKKLELQETDRDENKTIALGTSKLNYLDPRISVAWCKKYGVPIEKIFNKTQRDKFMWAIHMADENYRF